MPFFTVYVKATGAAYSSTHARAQLADPMPAHLDFVEQPNPPDLSAVMWDPTTLAYIPKPTPIPTRLEELMAKTAGPSGRIYTEEERDEIFKLLIGGTL